MIQKPASKETIQNLYENMGNNFSLFVPELCNCTTSLKKLNGIESNDKNEPSLNQLLLKLYTFSLIINLDISTFLRADLRSSSSTEKRCNLKYINVILIEGYSYLFGFKRDKRNALWKIVKEAANQTNDEEFINDTNDIQNLANNFKNTYAQQIDRAKRNLSIHYDSNPIKVHTLLSNISEDIETKKINAFLEIIENIMILIKKHIQKFQIPLTYSFEKSNINIWERINHFPDENSKLFTKLDGIITHFSKLLDKTVSLCNLPKAIQNKHNIDDAFSERLQPLIETVYPGIHILFIYLDLASAIRAYLSSEFYFEKQFNLRRIHIVVYEGFKHLYGFNDNDKEQSFWNKNISSIFKKSTNTNQLNTLTQIECDLKTLASDKRINNTDLRECVVHYRYKERDNVVKLFQALVKANPLIEMNKSRKLLILLPKLLDINNSSIGFKYNIEQEKIKTSNQKLISQIDDILLMTEKFKGKTKNKEDITNTINKIRNLLIQSQYIDNKNKE